MSEELKPCPFDGAEGDELGLTYEGLDARLNWFVRCYHCCVETQRYDSEEEAIAAWNRRASPTPPTTEGREEARDLIAMYQFQAQRGSPDAAKIVTVARALLSSTRVEEVERLRAALVDAKIDFECIADYPGSSVGARSVARDSAKFIDGILSLPDGEGKEKLATRAEDGPTAPTDRL